jgi:membrane protein required for colicin V production
MTIFDLIALGVVALSALSGYNRGVVAELLGLFAMALSAFATIAFLPATAPIARHILHAGWLSAVVAAVVTFVVVFMFLRLVAATLTRSINRSFLGGANRFGGLVFGGLRGVVFLALFALVFNRATPDELKPHWITGGFTYSIASDAGRTLASFLPKRFDPTGGFTDQLGRSIRDEGAKTDEDAEPAESAPPQTDQQAPSVRHDPPSSERAKPANHEYTKRARDSLDALVERSK